MAGQIKNDSYPPDQSDTFGMSSRPVVVDEEITPFAKGIVLLEAGDVTIIPAGNEDGDTVTFSNAPVGFTPPFRVRMVTAKTGEVATVDG